MAGGAWDFVYGPSDQGRKSNGSGAMSDEEQYELLASDGMLVKRPLVVTEEAVLIGFREKEWEDTLL